MNNQGASLKRKLLEFLSVYKGLYIQTNARQSYQATELYCNIHSRSIHTSKELQQQKDFYDTLGVQKGASDDDIKKAYRKKTLENHPDRNPDDKEAVGRFQEINKAYEVLKDKQKRQIYDQVGAETYEQYSQQGGAEQQKQGRSPFESGGFEGFGGFGGFPGGFQMRYEFDEKGFGDGGPGNMGSLFEDLIKQAMGQQSINITVSTRIGFMEAIKGVKKRIEYTTGTRSNPIKKVIDLDIPGGVTSGHELRVYGQGRQIQGSKGDLIVQIAVDRHPLFERRLNDIHSDIILSFSQATLGTTLDVETVHGQHKVKVQPGVQFGQLIQVKNKGAPIVGTSRFGDHILHIQVQIPTTLNDKQKELLQQFDEEELAKGNRKNTWW